MMAAEPVLPGGEFRHRWSIELDGQSPEGRRILAAGPLTCRATWRTMGLSSAEVLHIVETPDLGQQCDLPGHRHPVGFCQLPVFRK